VFESTPTVRQASDLSYPEYLDWKKLNSAFSSLDAYKHSAFALSISSGAEKASGARVTDGFFRTLGVTPIIGRDFHPGEDLLQAPRTALLSYSAWQHRYGGKADVLGKTVTLNGDATVIIGVLPREFHFAPAEPADFWAALHAASACDLRRSCHFLFGVGRLKEGLSMQAALADLQSIAAHLEKRYPGSNRDQGAALMPLSEVIVGKIRPILLVLLSAAVLLLIIAAVNIASLLLVHSESRRREIAVRHALGASGARIFGQFVTEGLVLVAAGSVLGVAAASAVMQLLVKLIPTDVLASMSYLTHIDWNIRMWAFAGVLALFAGVLFSFTPAVHLLRSEMRPGLTEGTRGSAGNAWRRLGSRLVVVELAIAMVLLVAAGLLGKSLYRLLGVDVGFEADCLLMLQISAPDPATLTTDRPPRSLAVFSIRYPVCLASSQLD
jgi:predicted permease